MGLCSSGRAIRAAALVPLLLLNAGESAGMQSVAPVTPRADSLAARAQMVRGLRAYLRVVDVTNDSPAFQAQRPAQLTEAAARLRAVLDSAARLSPNDIEVAVIRSYWYVMSGLAAEAAAIARETCTVEEWRCYGVLGFALHHDAQFAAAEGAFDRALELMPEAQRCMWRDISNIMNDSDGIPPYRALGCEERSELDARIWWLSDPHWMTGGNERRTEHFVRWMSGDLTRMQLEHLGWRRYRTDVVSDEMRVILTFGWMNWYGGVVVGCHAYGRSRMRLYEYCPRSRRLSVEDHFVMRRDAWSAPFVADVFDIRLDPLDARLRYDNGDFMTLSMTADTPVPSAGTLSLNGPRRGEGYIASVGKMHVFADAQTAFLLRGDADARLLAAFQPRDGRRRCFLRPDGWCPDGVTSAPLQYVPLKVGLAVSHAPESGVELVTDEQYSSTPVRLALSTRHDSAIVSLEARSLGPLEVPLAVRHRFAVFRPDIGVTTRVKSSDLVLTERMGLPPPRSAEEALSRMLPVSTLKRSEGAGVYWELYGLREGEVVEFELALEPVESGASVTTAVARALGLAERPGRVLVKWTEREIAGSAIGEHGETTHAIDLTLGNVTAGYYELVLTAKVGDDTTVQVGKKIRVE